jgi:hypothetical protein
VLGRGPLASAAAAAAPGANTFDTQERHLMTPIDALLFTLWFTLIHTGAYVIAGAIALRFSKAFYEGEGRLFDFVRDMGVPEESVAVTKRMLPGQLLRGVLMSVVLYPIVGFLGELSFVVRVLFFAGLMFIFTDLASADPSPGNIEGSVYLREKYRRRGVFFRIQAEMLIYSVLLGLAVSWLLF